MPRKAKELVVVHNKQVILSDAAKKALELLKGEANNSYYYQFEFGTIQGQNLDVVKRNDFGGCHAGMSGFSKASAIWTKMPRPGHNHPNLKWKYDSKVIVRWNDWLIHRSPWSMVPVPMDAKFASRKGFVIQNFDLPANLIVNFCIATRIPCEHAEHTKRWDDLVQAGCPETMAFVLAGCFGNTGKEIDFSNGHHPMESADLRTKLVENFVKGVVGNPNQPFKQSGEYKPCNKVWYKWSGDDQKYVKFLHETYPPRGHKPVVNNRMFNIEVVHEGEGKAYSIDELVAIGIAETKRLIPDVNERLIPDDKLAPEQVAAPVKKRRAPRKAA